MPRQPDDVGYPDSTFNMNTYMKIPVTFIVTALSFVQAATLEEDFRMPPVAARPYVWWHWMGPNFSKSGITKDLEAMKASGLGGATIFNLSSAVQESHAPTENNPWPDQTYRSPKYWEALRHAAAEADRLGLEIGLHNTVGYSTTGGPWIDEARGMQHLVSSVTTVRGGAKGPLNLPQPQFSADEGWGKTGRGVSFYQDVAVLAVPAGKQEVAPGEVVDLTGKSAWDAPAGNDWNVYRIGHAATGRPPHPVPDDLLGKVLEADKMSLEQTRHHWESVISPLRGHLGPLLGKSFRHFLIDSYEAGDQDWTPRFRDEFKRRKGYDPLPWLVTLRVGGRTVGDKERTARFQWDYRDVISALYYENGWAPAAEMIHAVGCELQWEPYGGPFDTVEGAALADLPMGEFWTGGKGNIEGVIVAAARAAGRRVIGAEAFTGAPNASRWTETPGKLKLSADGAFGVGVNRLILHHWVHQPFDDSYKPGMGMGWWGTHFSRHQTWAELGKEFYRYLGRCQALLQRGETPADFVSVGGARGQGDVISRRMFLESVNVENGKIALPSGRRYRFVHVSHDGKLEPAMVRRIKELLESGATVVAGKPESSPGLSGYPACDDEVRSLAAELWSKGNPRLFADLDSALRDLAITPSVRVLEGSGEIRIQHRREDGADWFFVANLSGQRVHPKISFAVSGREPELWNPETGTIELATARRINGDATEVDLVLGGGKSVFVMFRSNPVAVAHREFRSLEAVPVQGPWQVRVAEKRITLEKPVSLSESSDPDIRYFSGTSIYQTEFRLGSNPARVRLDLGDVRDLVRVTVNGTDCGIWWHPPYARDVSHALRAGNNTLRLEVCNTWHNRLVGDEQFPPDFEFGTDRGADRGRAIKGYPDWFLSGKTRPQAGRKGFVTWYYHRSDTPLIPSGLLGPVRLVQLEEGVEEDAWLAGIADDFLKGNLAGVEDHCSHTGGGTDASCLFNGTSANGDGGADTRDDGETFRGYGNGDWLVVRFKKPCDIDGLRTISAHSDARASQRFCVKLAYDGEPGKFIKAGDVSRRTEHGESVMDTPLNAKKVVALRLEFADGPLGFCVYREISVTGGDSPKGK